MNALARTCAASFCVLPLIFTPSTAIISNPGCSHSKKSSKMLKKISCYTLRKPSLDATPPSLTDSTLIYGDPVLVPPSMVSPTEVGRV